MSATTARFPLPVDDLLDFIEHQRQGLIVTDAQGTIVHANHAAHELLAHTPGTLAGTALGAIGETGDAHDGENEQSWRRRDGRKITVALSATEVRDHRFITFTDVSERVALQRRLYRQSITDPLTGLFNRRYFDEYLTQEFARATRYRRPFSTIIIDIDGFKQANDLHGHAYGDAMLVKARDIFNAVMRDGDTIFRYGGDEFAMILPETTKEGAIEVSNRLRERFAHQCSDKQRRIKLSLSIGIASYPEDGMDERGLIGAADRRMYHSKESGGNMITAFDALDSHTDEAHALLCSLGTLVRLMEDTRGMKSSDGISHSQEIRALAVEIGRRMALPRERLQLLEQAAMLHDIGTLYIPADILLKAERLDAREWEEIKRHTEIGAEIIAAISAHHEGELKELPRIVAQHHEWVNGEGYPDGLEGEEIVLEARILAVADAYTAMITPRPYRDALTREEALEELRRLAGRQFDPRVVTHLAALEARRTTPESITEA